MHRCPTNLDEHAKAHWKRHYKTAVDNGSLHDATIDSFEMMCRYWSLIQTTDPKEDSKKTMAYVMFTKYWQGFAISFGLMNKKPPGPKPMATLADIIKEGTNGTE